MSSAVTPSDSACHPSDTCRSRYSSGRSWTGLPPPLPLLVRSKPRFRPSVLPAPCSPSAVYAEPPFRTPWKARLSTNAPLLSSACVRSVSSACFPHQPRAFRMPPNKPARARSRHHNANKDVSGCTRHLLPSKKVAAQPNHTLCSSAGNP
ncbi:hypothetical protein PGT21_009728 [Puccinia graminis f. sp. tritici]|uniref:Uncharacterized protein n=1 Tax=Puccinia graminis f. sp. tritici TaxID=56615 RepID=A0A5B0PTX4_PUCGR|nr:hypothetical protein PGT21_009728 [Puccinia graminis f. sp. tritici]